MGEQTRTRVADASSNGRDVRTRKTVVIGVLAATVLGIGVIVTVAPTATMNVPTGGPLAISAPPGWFASGGTESGRYEAFWVAAQNKPMDPEALSRTKQYRDYSVWKDILSDRVLVRVQTAFTPFVSRAPLPETAFPLDWSRAQRLPDDWGFEVWELRFAVNQIPYVVVAHIGPDASSYDKAAARAAVTSVRAPRSESVR